jgi:hypothetical protein
VVATGIAVSGCEALARKEVLCLAAVEIVVGGYQQS